MPNARIFWRTLGLIPAVLLLATLASCTPPQDRLEGYLYLRLNTDPTTLDPARIVDVSGGSLAAKLFNGLVRFDEDLRLVPDLAESWEVSSDGRFYTFRLRAGVRFPSGRELTGEDIRYSFERVLHPDTRSPVTWVLNRLKGAGAFHAGRAGRVAGIRIPGPRRVRLELEEPFAPFLSLLAMPAAYVVDREAVSRWARNFGSHPEGTGPYRLLSWRRNRDLVLQANPDYFQGPPPLAGMVYGIIPEDLTAVVAFEQGRLDVVGVPRAEYARYRGDPKWRDLLVEGTGLNTYYLGLNCERAPFNDPRVRRAVGLALDRRRILETLYEGRGELAAGPIPSALWQGHSQRVQPLPYDPGRARMLLAQAGYPSGLEISLYLTHDLETLDVVEVIQHQLREVGIRANVIQREWSAFKAAVVRGEPDAFWLSWWADYPDPENFLFPVFHSANVGAGGNRVRFRDPRVDALIEAAQRTVDEADRYQRYARAEAAVMAQTPWIPFWHRKAHLLHQPWVSGVKAYPLYSQDKGLGMRLHRGEGRR